MKKILISLIAGVLLSQVHAAELKVAAIQFTSRGKAENIAKLSEMAIEAAKNGAKLIVMPEETVDYLAFNRQMGLKIAETFPGDVSTKFGKIAEQYKVYIVYGYYEIDRDTNVLYNSAAIVGPNGFKGNYRKNQLANAVTELDKVLTKTATNDIFGVGANLPAYAGTVDQASILEEIYKNRCIELYMSGLKLEDSRRFNRPTTERNRTYYPYPDSERFNNTNTPADPAN